MSANKSSKDTAERTVGNVRLREADVDLQEITAANRVALLQRVKFTSFGWLDRVNSSLVRNTILELEKGLAFNLFPVFLAIGILIYFSVPAEPVLWVVLMTAVLLIAGVWRIRFFGRWYFFVAAMASIVTGMLAAGLSSQMSDTRQIARQLTGQVHGIILAMDQNRRGAPRLLLKPIGIEGIAEEDLPLKIRLSTTAKTARFLPGEEVRGLARLQPVSGPVYPGSYDFSFFGWYNGLGGSGFFMGKPEIVQASARLNIGEVITVQINLAREAIKQRIVDAVPGVGGDVAVALITGDKSRIPEGVSQSLRKTGLAHILAISGLHMALVTLTLIWVVRLACAFFPKLVLHYPVKKWAVCAGFVTATFYLALSGMGVATQRAWIMISVMLLAVLLDRRAITIRSVAVSASLILLLNPENIFSPGFQMSFAAVASLVAGYEILRRRKPEEGYQARMTRRTGKFAVLLHWPSSYISGLVTTSLIAGTATSFVAAWHFHQVAPLGLLANVLAMPVVGLLIMPFALLSMLLMPYGLEFLALIPVDYGIGLVVAASNWVETLSPNGVTGTLPKYSLAIFGVFLAILTLFRTRLRLLCVAVIPALYLVWQPPPQPSVLISENGRAVAITTREGRLVALYPRRNKFVTDIWSKAWGKGEIGRADLPKEQCNSERCIVVLPSSLVLHVVYDPKLLNSSCRRADILVAPRLRWVNCRERRPMLILKRHDFEKRGSKALYITHRAETQDDRFKITVADGLPDSKRPWARTVQPID